MKKHCIFALVLILTLSVFTGCGCRRQEPAGRNPTEMTIAPTVAPTAAPTEHTAAPTENTAAATAPVVPDTTDHAGTEATNHNGTEATHPGNTESTTAAENNNARARTVR